eukprot:217254-Chlamydomonas_euryale.AAC.2
MDLTHRSSMFNEERVAPRAHISKEKKDTPRAHKTKDKKERRLAKGVSKPNTVEKDEAKPRGTLQPGGQPDAAKDEEEQLNRFRITITF